MTCVLAVDVLSLETHESIPAGSPYQRSLPERKLWFNKIVRQIVDRVWCPVTPQKLLEVVQSRPVYPQDNYVKIVGAKYNYCVCKQGQFLAWIFL